jgi:hypothetical protein
VQRACRRVQPERAGEYPGAVCHNHCPLYWQAVDLAVDVGVAVARGMLRGFDLVGPLPCAVGDRYLSLVPDRKTEGAALNTQL